MANVLNRATLEYRRSVNDPDYPAEDWIHQPDLSGVDGVPLYWWRIDGDAVREATDAEKQADIELHRARVIRALKIAVNEYGAAHYSERDEMRLSARLEEAYREGLTNRAAYIQTAMDWRDEVLATYGQRAAAVMAATTIGALDAVSLDFSSHDASDPHVDLTTALGITN